MKGIKRMFVLKKSSIITLCLIAVLLVAGYLNFLTSPINGNESIKVNTGGEEESFEAEEPENYGEAKFVDSSSVNSQTANELRYERDKKKSEILAIYKELSENKKVTEAETKEASAAALRIANYMDMETNMESLLSAKGFSNSVALITEDGVSVFVEKDTLEKTDIAIIRDVVIGETNFTSDKIRISNIMN